MEKNLVIWKDSSHTTKTFGPLLDWGGILPDFADIEHDYTQEFYRSYSSFIIKCPMTS